MAAHIPNPFAYPDIPGDTQAVLVLLESSSEMPRFWPDIRGFHLPTLFEALQRGSPGVPIQISWQTTADAPGNPPFSSPSRQLPDFFPAAGPLPYNVPLSTAHLQRAAEVLRAISRAQGSTRHLIVVAVSPCNNPTNFQALFSGVSDAPHPIQALLQEERIRLHMILTTNLQQQVLRQVHSHMLRVQGHIEAPLWFPVDTAKFSIHLAAKHAKYSGGGLSPLLVPAAPGASSDTVAPAATAIALPSLTPALESPVSTSSAAASPPTRRARAKAKEAAASAEPAGPGLVNYLKQIHGLTKKRNYSAKTSKRSATSDMPRASSSSRPILPRLDLPSALPAPGPIDTKGKQPAGASGAEPGPSRTRYTPIAPAHPPARQSDEARFAQGRRWPWLHPPHITSPAETAGMGSGASTALRNLHTLSPRVPELGGQFMGDVHPSMGRGQPQAVPEASSVPAPVHAPPLHRQATHLPYGIAPSPSSPHVSSPIYAQSSPEYHGDGTRGSPAYSSPPAPRELPSPLYSPQQPHGGYAYTPPYAGSQTSSPQPSPSLSAPVAASNDVDNQPFVVTPEYEASANARFEHALRSGAMYASMTPGMLSPVAASPTGYFAPPPERMIHQPPPHAPPGPHSSHHYPQNAPQPLPHDVLYHSSPGAGAASDSPPQGRQYYAPPPEGDPSHQRWYNP